MTALRRLMMAAGIAPLAATAILYTIKKPPNQKWIKALGNMSGLVSLELMAAQVAMGAKLPLVEGLFGFDNMMGFHRQVSYALLALTSVHAAEKALNKMGSKFSFKYLFTLQGGLSKPLNWGRLAFYVMALSWPLAYFQHSFANKGYVPRTVWKPTHYALYAAIWLAFLHAKRMGLKRSTTYGLWMFAAGVAIVSAFARVASMAHREASSPYVVTDVIHRTHDVTTVVLCKPDGKLPMMMQRRKHGQFAIIRRVEAYAGSVKIWSDPHPFTLSGDPLHGSIQFTIKETAKGSFTPTVKHWHKGDEVMVEGPYGIFSASLEHEPNIVMIAGGVGITPFLSWLRAAHHRMVTHGHVPTMTLFWGIKDERDVMCMEDFAQWAQDMPQLNVSFVLSSPNALQQLQASPRYAEIPERWREFCFQGFINDKVFHSVIRDDAYQASWYVCGPPVMLDLMKRELHKAFAVPEQVIHHEAFSW
eukprot:TRINITY_DN7170_c0_g1_i2.p1 TRINITY_DN7170_c0_g1~~TRINITY_DN7170_c0_g1_i2.p1  ORF type:complete len:551 (-),score=114.98 TRINITY_DN7170_c0_g1_i2:64-1485(-)